MKVIDAIAKQTIQLYLKDTLCNLQSIILASNINVIFGG